MPDGSVRAVLDTIRPAASAAVARLDAQRLHVDIVESAEISVAVVGDAVVVTTGLLREVYLWARQSLPPPERPLFRARTFGLVLAGTLAQAFPGCPESEREAQATAILEASDLGYIDDLKEPVNHLELRAARALWSGKRVADDD